MRVQGLAWAGAFACILLLAACNNGSGPAGIAPATRPSDPVPQPVSSACTSPAPAAVVNASLTDAVAQDFDATSNPRATTTVFFSILLPARCPGDTFPLVLHSHGYGGSRITTLAADGMLHPSDAHFASIDELVKALPYHGFVVISFDERGHGQSVPANGGGYARIIDPNAEVRDASAIIDWAYDHAAAYNLETLPNSVIPRDLMVGTIGYSYGGGFQMPLAIADPRIKTMVPNGTWNNLLYSLLPGDAVKLSFDGLLCLLGAAGGVVDTPLVATFCNAVGIQGVLASTLRTRDSLVSAVGLPVALPRPVAAGEINPFFFEHSTAADETVRPRGVPALFLQGNRDVLFNLTEAYWNASYFGSSGADTRVISTEGGHMNPLANDSEGTADCGSVVGVASVLAWLDHYLRGGPASELDAIPQVCISVADTVGAPAVTPVGVTLKAMPVGSQSGTGAVPAASATLTGSVGLLSIGPTFLPVSTISQGGAVLAGVPRIKQVVVSAGTGALGEVVAYVGTGILRAGSIIIVDGQVTSLVQGTHTSNRNENNDAVLLPAVGERLQAGDQVGLVLYSQNVQYSAVLSAASLPSATNVVNTVLGTHVPSIVSALQPLTAQLQPPNPYTFTATDVELPIIIPGTFPGSALVQ